jgi:hypothetical protein
MLNENLRIKRVRVATTGTLETGIPVILLSYSLGTAAVLQNDASEAIAPAASVGDFSFGLEVLGLKVVTGSTPSFVTYGIFQ